MNKDQKTILVVEDEETLHKIIKAGLEKEGYKVYVATDGEKAFDVASSKKPDLILLDIVLPKKSGLDVLKELRASEQGKSTPVIMLTNLSDTEDMNTAHDLGALDYLVKTDWTLADVIARIQNRFALIG